MTKKKYVIRHYWKQWVDITVEANSEEEAFEKAGDRYNDGDYEDDPALGNFENTDVENVTDIYTNNSLPFPNESEEEDEEKPVIRIFKIDVAGANGYSFAVKGEIADEAEALDLASLHDLFQSEEDEDYATAEDITNSPYDINGLKDATHEV